MMQLSFKNVSFVMVSGLVLIMGCSGEIGTAAEDNSSGTPASQPGTNLTGGTSNVSGRTVTPPPPTVATTTTGTTAAGTMPAGTTTVAPPSAPPVIAPAAAATAAAGTIVPLYT